MPLISPLMPEPLRAVDCCIIIAGESDKMQISHVIKTDQRSAAMQIRPALHFVVSPF